MPRGKACIYSYVHILFCQEIHEERITVSMIQEQLEVSWGTYILFKIKNSFIAIKNTLPGKEEIMLSEKHSDNESVFFCSLFIR